LLWGWCRAVMGMVCGGVNGIGYLVQGGVGMCGVMMVLMVFVCKLV
jgi:hypothetical protein